MSRILQGARCRCFGSKSGPLVLTSSLAPLGMSIHRRDSILSSSVAVIEDEQDHYNSSSNGNESPSIVHISHTKEKPQPTKLAYSVEKTDATRLVDRLLKSTKKLMGHDAIYHTVAFSGGVDSSLVAALVHHHCNPSLSGHSSEQYALAVLGVSPAVPSNQVELAERVANYIGIELKQVPTTEGSDETYIANAGQACFVCKTHLYSVLQAVVTQQQQYNQNEKYKIYNGTNADDLKDPTRLGLIAADHFKVQSPIRELSKDQVRIAARHFGLPNWNYAASPCLRSRLAVGAVTATREHLERIEKAEDYVRRELLLDETKNLRVRLLANNRACIEVDDVKQASEREWEDYFIQTLGFASITVRPYRTGSVAK